VAENVYQENEQHSTSKFEVHLEDFAGPFDVLLSLISKHKLDITSISLSKITDEFIEYVKLLTQDNKQLDELSQFILVAATLLDIKTARLVPGQENFDEEDLEFLESRELLFAKLLQYKAFKDISLKFEQMFEVGSGRYAREVPLPPEFAKLLPELRFEADTRMMAMMAAGSLAAQHYRDGGVNLGHIHMRQVNVAEQGVIVAKKLQKSGSLKFSELVKDAKHVVIVIGRFLSLLELYKMSAVEFDQHKALGELVVKWVAPADFNPEDRLTGSDFDTPVTSQPVVSNTKKKGARNGKK
jgi:segregation and condensation protein A